MGLLILGLIFGFVFVAGFFFLPILGVLFGAVVAGMLTKSPMKGLIAGAAGSAIVGAVLRYLGSNATDTLAGVGGTVEQIHEGLIGTLSGFASSNVLGLTIIDTVGGTYWFFVIALAIVGAIGGLIGGIAKKE
ncbi:hypothetical protein ACFLWJ_00605 [Chloroflexota bacterium]